MFILWIRLQKTWIPHELLAGTRDEAINEAQLYIDDDKYFIDFLLTELINAES